MLHVTGPRRAAALLYAAGLVAVVTTYVGDGVDAFAREDHWLQRLQALGELGVAWCVFRVARFSDVARVVLACAAVWLAVDETCMVHECLKPYVGALQPFLGRDPLIALYAIAAAAAVALSVRRIVWSPDAIVHAALAVVAAAVVALTDSAHALSGPLEPVVEESGELFAGIAAISLFLTQPTRPKSAWTSLAFVAVTLVWMVTAVWLARPLFCPARFLG